MRNRVWLILLVCLIAACARTHPAQPAENEPPPIKSVDVVKAIPQTITLARGESGDALVRLQITNGYHVNANPPSLPYLKPTEIEIPPAQGISVEFITYPDPLLRTFAFSETPLKVYEGDTNLKVRLNADKTATSGARNLSAKLRVQACDDKVCYAPGALDLIVPVTVK